MLETLVGNLEIGIAAPALPEILTRPPLGQLLSPAPSILPISLHSPGRVGATGEVLLAVRELLSRYPTLPNVYLIQDVFPGGGQSFISLGEADPNDFEVVAHYQLQHYVCLFHLGKAESYNPHLENGCWELVPNTNTTAQALPTEIWRCRECREFTVALGNEELLACSGCGYILYED